MDLIVKDSPIAGKGCFAGKDFKKGDIVGEYTGEIITGEEADARYEDRDMTYLFDIEDDLYIDGDTEANPVKYINHSCEGNCEVDQQGKRVFIRAVRNIKKGDELSYDYNLQVDPDDDDPYTCNCGSKHCRGTMKDLRD